MTDQVTPNEAEPGQGLGVDSPVDGKKQDKKKPWPLKDDEILALVREKRQRAESHLSEWYESARQDFGFYENHQWAEEDREKMENENRLAVTFNRVAPIINSVVGQEVNNRQEVRYLPRKIGEVSAADPMNDAVKWACEQCNSEDEDSDAFRDMDICGMGWTVHRMDYETNSDGMMTVERRDPLLMRWDTSARRKNLADAKWVQSDYWLTDEEIEDRWPDVDLAGLSNLSTPQNDQTPHDATEAWKYKNGASGEDRYSDQYRVIHHQQAFAATRYKIVDPASQQLKVYSPDDYKKLQDNADATGVDLPDALPVKQRVIWECWTVGGIVLESSESPIERDFTYQAMTCYRERETGYWFGLVRLMLDPQRYANRFMSLMASILATGAKGGVLYETGAFANPRKAKEDWAKHDSAIELTPGSLAAGKVMPKPPVQMPQSAAELMQFAIASIRDVSGVNVDMLGGAERDQPGIVEDMRTKAGLVILASVFDAMRLYRKRAGIIRAEFVQKFISDGRLIRVLGKTGEQFIPLIRQADAIDYDVVVDESPTSRDVKERTWMALQQIVPPLMQAGYPMPQEILDYSPLPQALVMAWKKEIAAKASQPQQPPLLVLIEQMKMQGQKELAGQKLQSDVQLEQIKAQTAQASEAARAQADAAVQQHKINTDAQLSKYKADLDQQTASQQHMLDINAQIKIANIKALAQVQSARIAAGIDAGDDVKSLEEAGADGGATDQALGMLLQHVSELRQHVSTLADAATAPKRIVRHPVTGRPVGVETAPVGPQYQ